MDHHPAEYPRGRRHATGGTRSRRASREGQGTGRGGRRQRHQASPLAPHVRAVYRKKSATPTGDASGAKGGRRHPSADLWNGDEDGSGDDEYDYGDEEDDEEYDDDGDGDDGSGGPQDNVFDGLADDKEDARVMTQAGCREATLPDGQRVWVVEEEEEEAPGVRLFYYGQQCSLEEGAPPCSWFRCFAAVSLSARLRF